MDANHYLELFQNAANKLDQELLKEKHLEIAVGEYLESVCIKLYKTAWANKAPDPISAESRIFFSIWIKNQPIWDGKVFYNIHAFKLRHLNGYSITSRNFAAAFRKSFKHFESQWPNVSIEFGPLTLMQGWKRTGGELIVDDIVDLSSKFIKIDYLVDELLSNYKKSHIK